ncbi:hypothetical protein FGO68_gene14263 [Halteria grandinella]|uniref:Uncharacterized protein n=1 Tax=Halteria grandinella TaxID=5974 RepID=A0A8J8N996_HALGN|nr:hypothetical protein FGO68_gene14263 [Halteria grandinella]
MLFKPQQIHQKFSLDPPIKGQRQVQLIIICSKFKGKQLNVGERQYGHLVVRSRTIGLGWRLTKSLIKVNL